MKNFCWLFNRGKLNWLRHNGGRRLFGFGQMVSDAWPAWFQRPCAPKQPFNWHQQQDDVDQYIGKLSQISCQADRESLFFLHLMTFVLLWDEWWRLERFSCIAVHCKCVRVDNDETAKVVKVQFMQNALLTLFFCAIVKTGRSTFSLSLPTPLIHACGCTLPKLSLTFTYTEEIADLLKTTTKTFSFFSLLFVSNFFFHSFAFMVPTLVLKESGFSSSSSDLSLALAALYEDSIRLLPLANAELETKLN